MPPFFSRLEPLAYRAAQAILVCALLYGGWSLARPHMSSLFGNPLGSSVVVFDVVKLANAQRAIASTFINSSSGSPDAATALANMQKKTRETIQRVAGTGTVVLVKQAVVSTNLPDITDEVLRELGLPLDVPTQNATSYTLDEAPTNLNLFPAKPRPQEVVQPGGATKLVP